MFLTFSQIFSIVDTVDIIDIVDTVDSVNIVDIVDIVDIVNIANIVDIINSRSHSKLLFLPTLKLNILHKCSWNILSEMRNYVMFHEIIEKQ